MDYQVKPSTYVDDRCADPGFQYTIRLPIDSRTERVTSGVPRAGEGLKRLAGYRILNDTVEIDILVCVSHAKSLLLTGCIYICNAAARILSDGVLLDRSVQRRFLHLQTDLPTSARYGERRNTINVYSS